MSDTGRKIGVCPECDSAELRRSGTGFAQARGVDDDNRPEWWCTDCGYKMDEPDYREPEVDQREHLTNSAGANALIQADPDDIP